jgi:ParB/Sulfiredoxin domain
MKKLKIHPAADWLPELNGSEFEELKQDIASRGLREPILVKHGHIIDGRHRYKACAQLGIEPQTKEFEGTGTDIIAEIASRNLFRRNLTPQQRAALVVKMCGDQFAKEAQARKRAHQFGETITVGLKSAQPQTRGRTAEKIAKIAKVGRDVAREALQSTPYDLEAVIAGKAKLAKCKPKRRKHPQCSAFERSMMGGKTFQQVVEARYVKFLEYFPVTRYPEVAEIVRGFIAKVR